MNFQEGKWVHQHLYQGTSFLELPFGAPFQLLSPEDNHCFDFHHYRSVSLICYFILMATYNISLASFPQHQKKYIYMVCVVIVHSHCCMVLYYVNKPQFIFHSTVDGYWVVSSFGLLQTMAFGKHICTHLYQVCTQEWNCWIIKYVYVQLQLIPSIVFHSRRQYMNFQ